MKIAVVSDIHGNRWALEAVAQDIARQGVDLVVNLGDLLSGPLAPSATADILISLGWPTIQGNHERQLLACAERAGSLSDRHAFEQTSAAQQAWLAALPQVLFWETEGIFACHGVPGDDRQYWLEQVGPDGIVPAAQSWVEQHAVGVEAGLILCGHSHQPRLRSLSGGRLLVNPGSVGLQAYEDDLPYYHRVENGSPHARYALCQQLHGAWQARICTVSYDDNVASQAATARGRADWAHWLATGCVA